MYLMTPKFVITSCSLSRCLFLLESTVCFLPGGEDAHQILRYCYRTPKVQKLLKADSDVHNALFRYMYWGGGGYGSD